MKISHRFIASPRTQEDLPGWEPLKKQQAPHQHGTRTEPASRTLPKKDSILYYKLH